MGCRNDPTLVLVHQERRGFLRLLKILGQDKGDPDNNILAEEEVFLGADELGGKDAGRGGQRQADSWRHILAHKEDP